MIFRDAIRAVPMQIQVVKKRMARETLGSNCQRLSKKYSEMAMENPKLKTKAKRAAVNPINPNSKRVMAWMVLKSAPRTFKRLIWFSFFRAS